jgi:hypothetical protein
MRFGIHADRGCQMRSREGVFRFVGLVAAVIGLALPAAASAESVRETENIIVPIAGTVPNPCTGEAVAVTGYLHLQAGVTFTDGVLTHSEVHVNLQGVSGVALVTGARYADSENSNEVMNFNPPQSEETTELTTNLVRQGESVTMDDFHSKLLIHVTINANGVPTAEVVIDRSRCN